MMGLVHLGVVYCYLFAICACDSFRIASCEKLGGRGACDGCRG